MKSGRRSRLAASSLVLVALVLGVLGCSSARRHFKQGTFSCSCSGTGCSCDHCKGLTTDCRCRATDAYGGREGGDKDE